MQQMVEAIVADFVHGIEAEAVEMVFGQPVAGVGQHEVAHHRRTVAVEIDRRAPGRLMLVGQHRRVVRQKIPLRPEVVVDHVEQHADA